MRVAFDSELLLTPSDPSEWILFQPFKATVYVGKEVRHLVVPAGYITDLASIPKWTPVTRSFLHGTARRAAVLHDYLYETQAGKEFADDVFMAAMKAEGVGWLARSLMFSAVHVFGHAVYDKRREAPQGVEP